MTGTTNESNAELSAAAQAENKAVNVSGADVESTNLMQYSTAEVSANLKSWLEHYNSDPKSATPVSVTPMVNQLAAVMKTMDYPVGNLRNDIAKFYTIISSPASELVGPELKQTIAYGTIREFYLTEMQIQEMNRKNVDFVGEYPGLLAIKADIKNYLPKDKNGQLSKQTEALFDNWVAKLAEIIAITNAVHEARTQAAVQNNPLGELEVIHNYFSDKGAEIFIGFFQDATKLEKLIPKEAWGKIYNNHVDIFKGLSFQSLYIKAIQWPPKYPLFLREFKYIYALPQENELRKQYEILKGGMIKVGDQLNKYQADLSALDKIEELLTADRKNKALLTIKTGLAQYLNGEGSNVNAVQQLTNNIINYLIETLENISSNKVDAADANIFTKLDIFGSILKNIIDANSALDLTLIATKFKAAAMGCDEWLHGKQQKQQQGKKGYKPGEAKAAGIIKITPKIKSLMDLNTHPKVAYSAFKTAWTATDKRLTDLFLNQNYAQDPVLNKLAARLIQASNKGEPAERKANIDKVYTEIQGYCKKNETHKEALLHFSSIKTLLEELVPFETVLASAAKGASNQESFKELHDKAIYTKKRADSVVVKSYYLIQIKAESLLKLASVNTKNVELIKQIQTLLAKFATLAGCAAIDNNLIDKTMAEISEKISMSKEASEGGAPIRTAFQELANAIKLAAVHEEILQASGFLKETPESEPAKKLAQIHNLAYMAAAIDNPIAFSVIVALKANFKIPTGQSLADVAASINSAMRVDLIYDAKFSAYLNEVLPTIQADDINKIMAEKHRQELINGVSFARLIEIGEKGNFNLDNITYAHLAELMQAGGEIKFNNNSLSIAAFKQDMANNLDVANKIISQAELKQLAILNPEVRLKGVDSAAAEVFRANFHIKVNNTQVINQVNQYLEIENIRKTKADNFKVAFTNCIKPADGKQVILTAAEYQKVRTQKLDLLVKEAQHKNAPSGQKEGMIDALAMDDRINKLIENMKKLNKIFLPNVQKDNKEFSKKLADNGNKLISNLKELAAIRESIDLLNKLDKKQLGEVVNTDGSKKPAQEFVSTWKEQLKGNSFKQRMAEKLKEFIGARNLNLEALQTKLEKNCLAQFEARVNYLAKQAEKILAEVEKCWKGNKNDPHKIAQLNQKAAGIHQELQQLRQACGRIGEADVQLPGSTILQAMQHLIIKAERAAGIKVDLTTNSATGALIRSESFALVEMPARLSAKADQAGPKIEQIMNMVGQANLSEEAKKNNISAKVSDYIQDEQAKEANVDRAQYKR